MNHGRIDAPLPPTPNGAGGLTRRVALAGTPRFVASIAGGAAGTVRPLLERIGLPLLLGVAALLFMGATVLALALDERRNREQVIESHTITRLARRSLALVIDRQATARGYLLTGDSSSFPADRERTARLRVMYDSLLSLSEVDSLRQARVRRLGELQLEWERAYRAPVMRGEYDRAGILALEREGAARFDRVRDAIEEFLEEENRLYRARRDRDARSHAASAAIVGAEILFLIGLLLALRRRQARHAATILEQQTLLEEQAQVLEEQALELELSNTELTHALAEQEEATLAIQQSEAQFRSVAEAAYDGLIATDQTNRVVFWNRAAEAMLGVPDVEARGSDVARFLPELVAMAGGDLNRLVGTVVQLEAACADESRLSVEVSVSRWSGGNETFYTLIVRDLTGRRRAESALARSVSLLQATFDSTADGMVVVDADGRVASWNRRFEEMWALTGRVTVGGTAARLLAQVRSHLRDPEAFLAKIRMLDARSDVEATDVLHCADGRVFEHNSTPQRLGGEVVGRVWSFRDVTARSQLEAELTHQAFHDGLTGLANRALFHDRVAHALERAARTDGPARLAVLFLDLDDFKQVNDGLGHAFGDRLLVAVAERIREMTRGQDTVARFGGDEFAILLEDVQSAERVDDVAERVAEALRQPLRVAGREIAIAASVGIAEPSAGDTVDTLLRGADLAMYVAKRRGKRRVARYEPSMHEAAVERLAVESDLRAALARDEFSLFYQPIVRLMDGSVTGVEALVRWEHPTRGRVSPVHFIPVAEEAGLIGALGRWVLRTACKQAARWQRLRASDQSSGDLPPLSVSVNLSGRQLQDPALLEDVASALRDAKLPASSLVLEITESVIMRDTEATLDVLRGLKQLGVRLAVDDFGTGYSSLSYLQRFPIDVLKIDKAFVDGVTRSGNDTALARTIVALGDTLALRTVAEGIESAEQHEVLWALGCEYGQGYLFSPPVEVSRVEELLMGGFATARG